MFGFYDNGQLIAARLQYPLQLGFSMTVHKSQGSSIQHLEIADVHMFAPGQQYTAYTRATSPNTLRVLPGYNKYALKPHTHVIHFYESSVRLLADLVTPRVSKSILSSTPVQESVSGPSDNVDVTCVRHEQTYDPIHVPDGYDTRSILHLFNEDVGPFPNLLNYVANLDPNNEGIQSMVAYLIFRTEEMFSDGVTVDKKKGVDVIPRKAFTSHISKILTIVDEQETRGRWGLISSTIPSEVANTLLNRLVTVIYKHVAKIRDPVSEMKEKLEGELQGIQPDTTHFYMSKQNCGKVRYLIGWAVFRLIANLDTELKSALKTAAKSSGANEAKIAELRQMKALCCALRADQTTLQLKSRFPYSLEHVNRKNRGGLFFINDNLFLFGMSLESLCGKLFKVEAVDILGKEATMILSGIVKNNALLKTLFLQYLDQNYSPAVHISLSHTPIPVPDTIETNSSSPFGQSETGPHVDSDTIETISSSPFGQSETGPHVDSDTFETISSSPFGQSETGPHVDSDTIETISSSPFGQSETGPHFDSDTIETVSSSPFGQSETGPHVDSDTIETVSSSPFGQSETGPHVDSNTFETNSSSPFGQSETIKEKVYERIIEKYLHMRNKEFLRPLMEKLNTHKETALRPALQAQAKKNTQLTFSTFLDDKTDKKDFTHLHLKSLATKGVDSFTIFTVVQLKLLLFCYGKAIKSQSKEHVKSMLCEEVRKNEHMLYPDELNSKNLDIIKKGNVPNAASQSVESQGSEDNDLQNMQSPEGATPGNETNQTATQDTHAIRQRARRFNPSHEQLETLTQDHINGNPVCLHQVRATQFGVLPSQIKRWHTSFKKRNTVARTEGNS
ncbi:uncharacterized protein LOC144887074 [Branchiostoma floridae x Branchiostoma japonicum]